MRKDTCAGWKHHPSWEHEIEKNTNGDAIGCHLKNRSQSWYCNECRYRDSGELPKE
jgi:hypothetical protein